MSRSPHRPLPARAPVGLVLAVIGLAVLSTGTFGVPWATTRFVEERLTYVDLMKVAKSVGSVDVPGSASFAVSYFGGVGLLLLILVAAFGLLSSLPALHSRRPVLRTLAALTALVAIGALMAAVTAISDIVTPSSGLWVPVAGYVLVFLSALFGPSRRASAANPRH